ncbi:MAG: transcription elongation factor GreA [Patescibacteria group bacterium]|nr:transcription elongation factor GreA [Patescibacteria group bacterium]
MKEKQKKILTPGGYKKLKEEYEELTQEKRKEIAEKIREAREQGDLSENAAYKAAKEEQVFVERRIDELETVLRQAKVVERSNDACGKVDLGCKVQVYLEGQNHEFFIVGAEEANPTEGKISYESPLGQALMGKAPGERVEVETPGGRITYIVKGIE